MRAPKRANNEGTVEYHRGKYRVRFLVDGKRKTVATRDTAEEAERMRHAWLDGVRSGELIAPGRLTVATLGEEMLDVRELHGSRAREEVRGISEERSVWRRHVLPSVLASMLVEVVGVLDLEEYLRWLRRRKAVSTIRSGDGVEHRKTQRVISTQTQRHALRLVRQVFDEAIRRELRTTNPAKSVSIPKPKIDLDEDWLRAGELDQVLACKALPLRDRTAYACAVGMSLRLSDIKALRLKHIDLDCDIPGPHARVWIAKSERWHRVPILPWLEPWIRAHIATLPPGATLLFPKLSRSKRHRREVGEYGKSYDFGWAEKVEEGRPREPGALEVAGVRRRVRFHDLRGTCATHLALGTWGRTWSLHEIQGMLAHSDQRVTERYVRRALDMLSLAARATLEGPRMPSPRGPGCPPLPPPITESSTDPAGFEPATFGSGGRGAPESLRELRLDGGQPGGNVGEIARAVLEAALGEEVPEELLQALRAAVLERDDVRLAIALEEPSPHRVRDAIRLAELLLEADAGVSRADATNESATRARDSNPGDGTG